MSTTPTPRPQTLPTYFLARALFVACFSSFGATGLADTRDDALASAKKAATFYWKQVSTEGGYLWRYSADLKLREGEGRQKTTVAWIQPPGTPSVGEAFVRLYEATGDQLFLDAAKAAADVLRRAQLRSGGWNGGVDFDPVERAKIAYRVDKPGRRQDNNSSLDDDKSQASLRFLVRLDRALKFQDKTIHEMTQFGLDRLLRAQYPNGGFPQVWTDEPRDPALYSGNKSASYPPSWPREYPGHENYWNRCTLNDGLMHTVITTLYLAEDVYNDKRFRDAATRAGDFLILAQLPDPQPAWAQQYDFDMHPSWARKFEPTSITGGESQGAMRILMEVYRRTGDKKYLEPIPKALAYLKKSQLPDGRLARFYEVQTNKPLYFTRDYKLTYDSSDMPTHYGFILDSQLANIEREYEAVLKTPRDKLTAKEATPKAELEKQARAAITGLDNRGAWVTQGELRFQKYAGPVIDMATTVANFNTLADYLGAK